MPRNRRFAAVAVSLLALSLVEGLAHRASADPRPPHDLATALYDAQGRLLKVDSLLITRHATGAVLPMEHLFFATPLRDAAAFRLTQTMEFEAPAEAGG